mgnify:CR=1 FL=1
MSNKTQDSNYANAAAAYGDKVKTTTTNQRELEGQLLIKYAQKMRALQDNWDDISHGDLDDVLSNNRKLWTLFYDTAIEEKEGDQGRPDDLRKNIIALSEYIFNRTIKTLAAPEKNKLDILIDINKEIAAGLLAKQEAEKQAEAASSQSSTADDEGHKSPQSSTSTSA